jgi:hypothetical protein
MRRLEAIFAAGLLWWHFTCPEMDYGVSPDWYAGAV